MRLGRYYVRALLLFLCFALDIVTSMLIFLYVLLREQLLLFFAKSRSMSLPGIATVIFMHDINIHSCISILLSHVYQRFSMLIEAQ